MARPNVILILADQHRWDFTGHESAATVTPNLDSLAASGAVFRSAYCTSPLCSPSRAAIASGRYGAGSGSFTNLHQLPPGTPSFVSQLRSAGYSACAVGKTHMEIHAYDSDLASPAHREYMDSLGWDEVTEVSGNGMLKTGINCSYTEFLKDVGAFDDVLQFYRQWRYFMDKGPPGPPEFFPYEWPLAPELQETEFVGSRAIDWIENRPRDGNWFLHVGFAGPHSPIEPAPKWMDLYRDRDEPAPPTCAEPLPSLADGRRGYRAMISQIDHWVGRIRQAVEARGELDNTIIIYSADHGEMAGEQNMFGKCVFYDPSVRVPLIAAGPGVAAGLDLDCLVSLVDLGATVCGLTGIEAHDLDDGRSLVPVLSGETAGHRDEIYVEMGCDRMLYDGRYKLMLGDPSADARKLGRLHLDKPVNIPPSQARLFDMEADPAEEHDLAPDPSHGARIESMAKILAPRMGEGVKTLPFLDRGEYRPL